MDTVVNDAELFNASAFAMDTSNSTASGNVNGDGIKMFGPAPPNSAVAMKSDLKSSAVVKYSSMKIPMQFSTIRLNTDLNHPPSDRQSPGCYRIGEQKMFGGTAFSSFNSINMANSYQELVGKVDVISSAKNIKALLKMPYSESPQISIMVHRLRKTLLLEEFDVHKNLLRQEAEQWSWLKSFYQNTVDKQEEKMKCLVSAGKGDSDTDNIYLNLLKHSFAASSAEGWSPAPAITSDTSSNQTVPWMSDDLKGFHHETLWEFEDISMLIDSDLPIFGSGNSRRPCISLRLRDARSPPISVLTGLDYWLDNLMSNVPEVAMCYHINGFVQKYEVIRTEDIPQLNNSSFDPDEVMDIARNIMAFIKANAAVEGHTYWLYKSHNDDMVKLYDLTDHCQNEMGEGDNPFTVPVGLLCYRVGRNLKVTGQRRTADCRALLENCIRLLDDTKHSQVCADAHFHLSDMWVPDKSINDIWFDKKISEMPSDLYDEEDTSDEGLGIFTDREPDDKNGDNCEELDDIVEINKKKETHNKKDSNQEEIKNVVALRELVVRGMIKRKAWDVVGACRIAGETDERCNAALKHIRKGLNCIDKDYDAMLKGATQRDEENQKERSPSKAIPLHYFPLDLGKKQEKDSQVPSHERPAVKEEVQKMHDPSKAIPLHYKPLSKATTKISDTEETSEKSEGESCSERISSEATTDGCNSFFSEESYSSESWHNNAKFNLLRKAAISYFVLAKSFYEIRQFGRTLRHLRYSLHCHDAALDLEPLVVPWDQMNELYILILLLAAKTRCCLVTSWGAAAREWKEFGEEEAAILSSAQIICTNPDNKWVYEWPANQEDNWIRAEKIFRKIKEHETYNIQSRNPVFRKDVDSNHATCLCGLANTQMDIVKDRCQNNKESLDDVRPIWERAVQNYGKAIKMLEALGEKNTAAHMICNLATLHTLAANAVSDPESVIAPFTQQELDFHDKTIKIYERGLNLLGRGETMDETRECIHHTLRKLLHQMALRYFHFMKVVEITDELLKSVKKLLNKSLSYCHPDCSGKFQHDNRFWAARNRMNLARIFDTEINLVTSAKRRRFLLDRSEEQYKLCYDLYGLLGYACSQICVKEQWIITLSKWWSVKHSKKTCPRQLQRTCLLHLSDLYEHVARIDVKNHPTEDSMSTHPSPSDAVGLLLDMMNTHLLAYLKLEPKNSTIKSLYQRCLRLLPHKLANDLPSQLSVVLFDLREAMTIEPS